MFLAAHFSPFIALASFAFSHNNFPILATKVTASAIFELVSNSCAGLHGQKFLLTPSLRDFELHLPHPNQISQVTLYISLNLKQHTEHIGL
jgi:hypothetical protein